MAGGLGIAMEEVDTSTLPQKRPVLPEETAALEIDSEARDPMQRQSNTNLPKFKDSPMRSIGLVLSQIGARMKGQPTPIDLAKAQAMEQESLAIDRLQTEMTVTSKMLELAATIPDDKLPGFIDGIEKSYGKAIPGISKSIQAALHRPDAKMIADTIGPNAELYYALSGGNSTRMMDLARDPEIRKMVDERNDRTLKGPISAKLSFIRKAADSLTPEQKALMPLDEAGNLVLSTESLHLLNAMVPEEMALNSAEMGVLERNPALAAERGISMAGEAVGQVNMLSKTDKQNLGLPNDVVAQWDDKGNLQIQYKPPTTNESDPSGTGAQRERKIADQTDRFIRNYGMNPVEAKDYATKMIDGIVKAEMTDTGAVRLIDQELANTNDPAAVKELQPLNPADTQTVPQLNPGYKLYDLTDKATGPLSAAAAFTSATVGLVGADVFGENIQARQVMRTFTQDLVRSLAVNDQFPVGEQNRIMKEVNTLPTFFDSPPAMRNRMKGIDLSLRVRAAQASRDSNDTSLSEATRTAQRSNAKNIENFLANLGVPKPMSVTDFDTVDEVKTMDVNTLQSFIGTAPDETLNQLPDDVFNILLERSQQGK